MSDSFEIRESVSADRPAIESLYPEAFPDEDLLPLVRDLVPDTEVATSLVAVAAPGVIGHVIFTACGVVGSDVGAALLAPLAVARAWQRQGVGSAIVRAGLRRLEDSGVAVVCVLGDPAYYGRLGFARERLIEPPYPLPPEWDGAWQSRYLGAATASCAGRLSVPRQWRQPALWAP